MPHNHLQILIVADEPDITAMLATHIMTARDDAHVSVVDTIKEARRLAASDAFDVIVAQENLSDGSALGLVEVAAKAVVTPLVVVAPNADVEQVRSTFREGAADVIDSAADGEGLLDCIDRVVARGRQEQRRGRRSRRLRRVSSRLIKDRRELRQRVDLICRDVVDAYRRLAEKVVAAKNGDDPRNPIRRAPRPMVEDN
ncbi:MAG TPA: hypothetical protein VJZ71_04160 [Phycisphaerae bacterium]|nr:hypothetical protein [Phycisphaerae bacterium]